MIRVSDRATVNADVVGEHLLGCPVHLVARLEAGDPLAESFDDTGELEQQSVPGECGHVNQNHLILWLNHGLNLVPAMGRRIARKV